MRTVTLIREQDNEQGTFSGVLVSDGFICECIELPWRDNTRSMSCIPVGEYTVTCEQTSRYGECYYVHDVPGRSGILIHPGNYAGNTEEGWKTHSKGCILLGYQRGTLHSQKAALNSRAAVSDFMAHLNNEPFKLRVESGYELADRDRQPRRKRRHWWSLWTSRDGD